MSTLQTQFTEYNDRLDRNCQRRFGVGIKVFKTINAIVRLAAVALGGFTVAAGGDPTTVMWIVGAIVVGPDIVEYVVATDAGKK